ncbi:hypothetical protein VNI00_015130 [Paramarasmius palmivorus]|uniref:Expansin-like EG45 domain-containing protein n=1 Tax=Paramarasmius palmivorus TaxID=297713 RepID=A0AAW0BPC6_9AGAR
MFAFASLLAFTLALSVSSTVVPEVRDNQIQARQGEVFQGGFASFFNQGGVAGACGQVHSDSDLIAAIALERYGSTAVTSPLCGRRVVITNTRNGKSVTATIADACPTCQNANSFDLSIGAFTSIAALADGLVPIEWHFV